MKKEEVETLLGLLTRLAGEYEEAVVGDILADTGKAALELDETERLALSNEGQKAAVMHAVDGVLRYVREIASQNGKIPFVETKRYLDEEADVALGQLRGPITHEEMWGPDDEEEPYPGVCPGVAEDILAEDAGKNLEAMWAMDEDLARDAYNERVRSAFDEGC